MNDLEITGSYSRTINHAHYGGAQFENSNHFFSVKGYIQEGEDPKACARELNKMARQFVEESIETEIMNMTDGSMSKKEFDNIMVDVLAGKPIVGDPAMVETMTTAQRFIFQYVKRANKRLQARKENNGTKSK